ncbi:MAG: peptide chain release factor N(5)-glutamine methyltransferase [Clostridiales bacterium]|nr:peptide chain release factor N(5)-glutamine methyltransferase [Clostridiales bacterium]
MVKTYNDLYIRIRRALRAAGVEASSLEARLLLAHAAGKTVEKLLQDMCLYCTDTVEADAAALLRRRLAGEPVAYITGSWEFYGMPLEINEHVLIPRADTEVLVEKALDKFIGRDMSPRVLDLCSGSGCIGCAIARELPASRVVMLDISDKAISLSRRNVLHNKLTPRVTCIQMDVRSAPPVGLGTFDLIVSNPPYIPSAEMPELDASVRDYEPHTALDGGRDGLDFYHAILGGWQRLLRPGGWMFFEVGEDQAEHVSLLMRAKGFRQIEQIPDTRGVLRVVDGCWPGM